MGLEPVVPAAQTAEIGAVGRAPDPVWDDVVDRDRVATAFEHMSEPTDVH
jgi:hypothetical protein